MKDLHLERLKDIQKSLAEKVRLVPLQRFPDIVGGADVAYDLKRKLSYGIIVVLRVKDLKKDVVGTGEIREIRNFASPLAVLAAISRVNRGSRLRTAFFKKSDQIKVPQT